MNVILQLNIGTEGKCKNKDRYKKEYFTNKFKHYLKVTKLIFFANKHLKYICNPTRYTIFDD